MARKYVELTESCVGVSKVGGIFVHKHEEVCLGEKSTFALREDDMSEPLPAVQDVAAQQFADELTQAVQGELLEMARLLEGVDPASLFGATEFEIRDLALKIAAKAYQQRLAQKKTRVANSAGGTSPPVA
jgi:hypothetical protein